MAVAPAHDFFEPTSAPSFLLTWHFGPGKNAMSFQLVILSSRCYEPGYLSDFLSYFLIAYTLVVIIRFCPPLQLGPMYS